MIRRREETKNLNEMKIINLKVTQFNGEFKIIHFKSPKHYKYAGMN